MLRRSLARNFFFTWQSENLEKVAAKKNWYSSNPHTQTNPPIWLDISDLNFCTKKISPLKPGELPTRVTHLPSRVVLYNLKQLNYDPEKVESRLREKIGGGGEDNSLNKMITDHTSFSTGKVYKGTMAFHLEQRAVVSGLSGGDAQHQNENQQQDAKNSPSSAAYAQYVWLTPREAEKQNFSPKRDPVTGERERPFALLTKAPKDLFAAAQFQDSGAFAAFPINVCTGRLFETHQRAGLVAWHRAHLDTLSDSSVSSSSGESQAALVASADPKKHKWAPYVDQLAIFGSATDFADLKLELREDADGVEVPRFYSSKPRTQQNQQEQQQEQQNDSSSPSSAAAANFLSTPPPTDRDVFFFKDIVDQDRLWQHARRSRPSSNNNDQETTTTEPKKRKHFLLPTGVEVFPYMRAALDAKMAAAGCAASEDGFWISRSAVQRQAFTLKEGASVVSALQGKKDDETNEQEEEVVKMFHISQAKMPLAAMVLTGMHTR